ncbi:EAL domain-containing protein [Sphaerospermopsis aphanizomenoides BCCUSP55]|uniref:putative bifunctional diguanylate cyclase/phosphodiesterase n=1 Tax=Sphaerospermopsis aphanizomenoides TaxID=459663 RepID=UPI001902C340|nr:GGDEF domain-containing response regulator [Sphaerospermopsis aphanizomenoides]MBK1988251.1 EAL domain-containing protein [Sphaerospermopsis aphanizomenoides BCCUSP55]
MNNQSTLAEISSSANQINILVVDDVLENVRLLSSILERNGYETRKAISGTMALTTVEAALPTLILLDIRMPDMNGYQVCQQLKSNPKTAHIPIIFLSAADDISDKIQAFQVGGADYITKPFHIEEVLARVKHQLTIIQARQTICDLNTQLEARVRERTQQLEIANFQLAEMAFQDSLTKLPNRSLLMEKLWESIATQQADPDYQFAVFYLDCDRFKIVNDSLGHLAGDELLIAVTQRLKSLLDDDIFLARLGGDEFVILLKNFTNADAIIKIAESISQRFTDPFHLREREVFLSFSIGIVSECSTYSDPEALLRDADIAMYKAKSLGKEQYQIFVPKMHQNAYQRLQIETDLRKAIQNEKFILHYQPIIDLITGKAIGVEALIRWQHPTQGLISPADFIPLAEETGLILKIGYWTLKQACHQLHLWQENNIVDSSFSVSVNLSAYQFAQSNLLQQIDDILTETQIPPECLKLEITETAIMENVAAAAQVIKSLRQRRIQLSIDDFGTGYSSLSYLHSFPVDNLKIDRSFVQHLHEKSDSLALVNAIVQIAKTMGMNIIAEGIETDHQLEQLKLLDCQFGQGYLFSEPLDSEKITSFMTNIQNQNSREQGGNYFISHL